VYGYEYQKIGVMLLDITDAENEQYSFYEYENYDQSDRVMEVLDGVNSRYGSSTLILGAQGRKKVCCLHNKYASNTSCEVRKV
jgi:hypothetical protein